MLRFLVSRMERSFDAVQTIATAFDRRSIAEKSHCRLAWHASFFMSCRLRLISNAMRCLTLYFVLKILPCMKEKIMFGLDFGIAGKKAIVCASSKGLGFGCKRTSGGWVDLVMCVRGADRLHEWQTSCAKT